MHEADRQAKNKSGQCPLRLPRTTGNCALFRFTVAPDNMSAGISCANFHESRPGPAPPRQPRRSKAKMKLSVNIWRIILPRLAQKLMRSAISLVRLDPRTRNKFATFAHAMSNTKSTAPREHTRIAVFTPYRQHKKASRIGWSVTLKLIVLLPGYSFANRAAMPSTFYRARLPERTTPGASLPITTMSPRSPRSLMASALFQWPRRSIPATSRRS